MSNVLLPAILAISAVITAFMTYRDIRRGGARFYTLEREAILKRASLYLGLTVLLFIGAVGLLFYQRQQGVEELAVSEGEEIEGVPTATATLASIPPTETATATPDPDLPTPTVTPRVCRAIVRGTGGSGLNLREEPSGAEIEVLQEEDIVSLVDDAPQQVGATTWIHVRTTITRSDGWVALDFLFIEDEECLSRVQP